MKTMAMGFMILAGLLLPAALVLDARAAGYDRSLFISPVTLMQQQARNTTLFLVDIRPAKEFAQFKIPGSINLPLSFIKTKRFLKTRPVILIHKGYEYRELHREAKTLNQKGYAVKILAGGLMAWRHKQGKIVGKPFGLKTLNRMPVNHFFREKDNDQWVLLNACRDAARDPSAPFPKAIAVKDSKEIGTLIDTIFTNPEKLGSVPAIPKANPMLSVIVFDNTGSTYKELESLIGETFYDRVFYLEGGVAAYDTFARNRLLARQPKSLRTKSVGKCPSCKKQNDD